MKSFYGSAFEVIVWLGNAIPRITEDVFSMLENNIDLDPTQYDAIDFALLQCIHA